MEPAELFNQICVDISVMLYKQFGKEDMSSELTVTLEFDELQRVSNFLNLKVDGYPKIPPFEFMGMLNVKAQEILQLPEIYKLKSLGVDIKPGGDLHANPTFVKVNSTYSSLLKYKTYTS